MAKVISKRVTANIEGDFVVFLIGLRINKPWKIHKWLPAALAMPKMIKELYQHPECGFLGRNAPVWLGKGKFHGRCHRELGNGWWSYVESYQVMMCNRLGPPV